MTLNKRRRTKLLSKIKLRNNECNFAYYYSLEFFVMSHFYLIVAYLIPKLEEILFHTFGALIFQRITLVLTSLC